jgi:hypothetical protein
METYGESSVCVCVQALADLMQLGVHLFEKAACGSGGSSGNQVHQVMLIITDGRFNKAAVKRYLTSLFHALAVQCLVQNG